MTHFAIIIIGDEILSGKRADKHLPKAIELLGARGLQLAYADYVGDDKARITSTLARAFAAARESGDVVFSCGGIGATPDDHTRQCAAAALGVELALHPQAKALITERMQDTAKEQGVPFDADRHDNIHRLNMGMFPAGCDIIPNPYNKIPGFTVKHGAGGHHFVPGFPVMAHPMVEWVLDTLYPHLFHQVAWQEKSVYVYESMESTLTPLMEAVESVFQGVKVFSLPSVGDAQTRRHIELGVKGDPAQVAPAFEQLLAGLDGFRAEYKPV